MAILRGDPRISSGETPAPDASAGAGTERQPERQRTLLCRFLQDNVPLLLGIIRSYVVRSGLAYGDAVQAAATEVFHDAVYEALTHAERFDPTTQPQAWFLAIALNRMNHPMK
jgi:DNA-directed RNA polymerase specialized sigma24 family protein